MSDVDEPQAPQRANKPARKWRRRLMYAAIGVVVAYVVAVLGGLPVAWPFDYPSNLGFTPVREDLRLPADGKRRVVVMQHGILRSHYSLGRIARTLREHGYEVHNLDYPSRTATIDAHADLLAAAIGRIQKDGAVAEFAFVGHSMGGLVIQEYLRRAGAPEPSACVYVATPHRGAILADLRKHWFGFRLVMGTEAADQLSPGAAVHRRPIPFVERSGCIIGDIGEGNASIPGHDDGTVAVAEAALPGAASVLLPFGHTRIAFHPRTAEQVLVFLRRGTFEGSPPGK